MRLEIEVQDKEIFHIIDSSQPYVLLADERNGLIFTEGPVWDTIEKRFLFSDIAGNKMYTWSDALGLVEWAAYSFKANGNAYDGQGNLVSCEHATSRIVKRNKEGKDYEVLCTYYGDKELNSPNDVIVKKDGSIYFTDPCFGRKSSKVGVERKQQLNFQGIYRYTEHDLTVLDQSLISPNGLCFNLDETKLFVNDSPEETIWVFDVTTDGKLTNKKIWAKTEGSGKGLPDGMKIDCEGNLYCCAQGGIHIFNKDGKFLGRICFPVQVANFTFGGVDGKILFICATDRIYSIRGKVCGVR